MGCLNWKSQPYQEFVFQSQPKRQQNLESDGEGGGSIPGL